MSSLKVKSISTFTFILTLFSQCLMSSTGFGANYFDLPVSNQQSTASRVGVNSRQSNACAFAFTAPTSSQFENHPFKKKVFYNLNGIELRLYNEKSQVKETILLPFRIDKIVFFSAMEETASGDRISDYAVGFSSRHIVLIQILPSENAEVEQINVRTTEQKTIKEVKYLAHQMSEIQIDGHSYSKFENQLRVEFSDGSYQLLTIDEGRILAP